MNTPDTISNGRYRIESILGRGAQGTVYLARDTHLERAVALKSVGRGRGAADRAHRLLAEARALGQLNHPHLATVFDALEHDGSHYLVLEYVDGQTVDACLRRRGALDRNTAAGIALQVLDGLAHAHDKNIVHRDVKPSNIVIDRSGKARLIDFGIAVAEGTRNAPSGTPQYAAPEALDEQAAGKAADVFSLSLVLYEMLTGCPAVAGAGPFEVMHKIANLPIPAPSSIRPGIDERLDDIVLKGLIKKHEDRYPDARAMHRALQSYLQPGAETGHAASGAANQRALDFVLMRMRVKSSFPALSRTISTINRIASSDDESMQTLATALLKDFSLTNKLLRLVNSSTYGQFGGNISTISRAVMILGFDTVRNLAVTLILLEHLQNRHQAGELRGEVVRALFNGIMTRRLLGPAGGGDPEEGFICGVFFNLGRLLAMYYLYDEWIEIGRRIHAGAGEHDAACAVLGLSLEELGIGVARSWNLPERMVRSMERIQGSPPQAAGRDSLRIAANVGDMLCRIASHTEPGEKMRHLEDLTRRCRPRLQMTARDYASAVEESVEKFNEEARLLINDHSTGPMLETIRIWSSGSTGGDAPAAAGAAPAAAPAPHDETGTCAVLTAGIQDITSTLVNGCSLNDVLRMVLETMYRGIGFDRVLLALRETRGTRFSGRFGFGSGNEGVVKAFAFDLRDHSDVFQLAAGKCLDLVIADSTVDNIRARIPQWHHEQVRARSFIVLPLAIDKRCVGLLYGDRTGAGSPAIGTASMGLLKTLRDQAVLAFRQR